MESAMAEPDKTQRRSAKKANWAEQRKLLGFR
jgi:hypothetical protein